MWHSLHAMRSLTRLLLGKTSQHTVHLRGIETATSHAPSALKIWEASSSTTPPVSFVQGMAPPTAMSWLRRRGPDVSHMVREQLFKSRQVRVFDGEKVKRIKDDKVLGLGDILIYPKNILFGGMTEREAGSKFSASASASGTTLLPSRRAQPPPQQQQQQQQQEKRVTPRQSSPHVLPLIPSTAPLHKTADEGQHMLNSSSSSPQHSLAQQPSAAPTITTTTLSEPMQQHSTITSEHHTTAPPSLPATTISIAQLGSKAAQTRAASLKASRTQIQTNSLPVLRTEPAPASPSKHADPVAAARTIAGSHGHRVRSWMLGNTSDMVFINKPAGIASMGPDSLNSMMQEGLRLGPIDEPKLVHRLDKLVSGAMVVARNADAAHWLSACFREKSAQGVTPGAEPHLPPSMHVKRVYWAFVAGYLQPRLTGRIRYPILVDGKYHPAVTQFRVKHTCEGVSWLELVPETGRRHQLRIHCAQCLRTPIIGDTRYGYKGLTPTQGLFRGVPREWWNTFGGSRQASDREQLDGETEAGHRSGRGSRGPGLHTEQHTGVDQESYDDGDDDGGLEEGEEMVQMDGHEGGEGWGGTGERKGDVAGGPLPIFLHSRRLVVKKPLRHAVVAIAPLPRYIRQLVVGLGWPLPTH